LLLYNGGGLLHFLGLLVVLLLFGELFKEFNSDFFKSGFELRCNLVLIGLLFISLSRAFLVSETFIDFELLLTTELTVENCLHDFLLLRL